MSEQLNYNINISGNANESVGSLKKQLREATAEVAILSDKFGATSKEAIEAAKRAAELRDRIGDARALTEAFNPDAKFRALSASLSGVAGGFAAVQGAIGLFGTESKELEKQLLKVQSALALSQGLQSIGESIDSFKQLGAVIQSTTIYTRLNAAANAAATGVMTALGFSVDATSLSFKALKAAIAATGIGLAIVAIGELISAISSYTSAADKAKEAQDKLNESIKNSAEIALEAEIAKINQTGELLKAEAKLREASEKEINEIEQTTRRLRIAARNRYNKEIAAIDAESARKNEAAIKSEQDAIRLADINFQISEKERRKKNNEARLQEDLEQQKKLDDIAKRVRQAGFEFEKIELENKEKKKKKQEEEEKKDTEDADKKAADDYEKESKRLDDLNELRNKNLQKEKFLQDEELKATVALQDAKFAAASAGLNLLGALVGENEKVANALFAVDRALAIAKIVIDTQKEISGYSANLTWTALPDGGALIKSKYILAAKLRAAASIGTVAATTIAKFKGGAAASNFGGGGSINTFGTPIVPTQQAQLTQLNQQSINAIGNSAIRAYVVETDITSNQKRVQAIKQRARFS
jgi:chromosome segregation ATPase